MKGLAKMCLNEKKLKKKKRIANYVSLTKKKKKYLGEIE